MCGNGKLRPGNLGKKHPLPASPFLQSALSLLFSDEDLLTTQLSYPTLKYTGGDL